MGAYGGGGAGNEVTYDGGDGRSPWSSPAEHRAVGSLAEHLAGLGVGDASSKESLFQVMNAVEAAESIIKQQVRFRFSSFCIFFFLRNLQLVQI